MLQKTFTEQETMVDTTIGLPRELLKDMKKLAIDRSVSWRGLALEVLTGYMQKQKEQRQKNE
jgi:hypothetical protein